MGYLPLIIAESCALLADNMILHLGRSILAFKFENVAYGILTACETSYYAYIYSVIDEDRYQTVENLLHRIKILKA